MQCVKCRAAFPDGSRARAFIAVFVMGDEYIYSYWFCDGCGLYTVESYHDRFMGDDEISFLPPVEKDVGDRAVELIRRCPDPSDKNCECESHQALYYGRPSV